MVHTYAALGIDLDLSLGQLNTLTDIGFIYEFILFIQTTLSWIYIYIFRMATDAEYRQQVHTTSSFVVHECV